MQRRSRMTAGKRGKRVRRVRILQNYEMSHIYAMDMKVGIMP